MQRRRLSWLELGLAFFALVGVSEVAPGQAAESGRVMLEAAARGDVETLKRLVAVGAPVDPVNAARETPLLLAV